MVIEHSRYQHRTQVISFLQKNVSNRNWKIILPRYGTGNETYFARDNGQSYFIKLGAETVRYQVMSNLGLSPPVIATGYLEEGISVLVQQQINGKKPSRKDFHRHLRQFAQSIRKVHHSEELKRFLPERASSLYKDVGLEVLGEIERRWRKYESKVPISAEYVNEKIDYLKNRLRQFDGRGLVASHNDICNGNWLVSSDESIYLLDYESMSLDDPALDVGAILWWYYPPEKRKEFIEIAGYTNDENFGERMRIRMAVHNLSIIISRKNLLTR